MFRNKYFLQKYYNFSEKYNISVKINFVNKYYKFRENITFFGKIIILGMIFVVNWSWSFFQKNAKGRQVSVDFFKYFKYKFNIWRIYKKSTLQKPKSPQKSFAEKYPEDRSFFRNWSFIRIPVYFYEKCKLYTKKIVAFQKNVNFIRKM